MELAAFGDGPSDERVCTTLGGYVVLLFLAALS